MNSKTQVAGNSCVRAAAHLVVALAVLGLAALLVANHFLRPTSPFIALAGTINHLLFLLALPLGLGLLLFRTRAALALFAVLVTLFLVAHPVLPSLAAVLSPQPDGATLTAMTFNLGAHRTPPRMLAQTIAASEADIVAVQELTSGSAAVLASELAAIYPFQILDLSTGTTGFLSRLPILDAKWNRPPAGRPFLHVIVEHDGAEMHVFPVHFYPPRIIWSKRFPLPRGLNEAGLEAEVAYLLQQTAGITAPVIVMGDFNMSDQIGAYNAITTALTDAYRHAGYGLGLSFPNNAYLAGIRLPSPLLRIDYLFYSPQLEAISARVNCVEGQSDHCPLLVDLVMPVSRRAG